MVRHTLKVALQFVRFLSDTQLLPKAACVCWLGGGGEEGSTFDIDLGVLPVMSPLRGGAREFY